jgi:hypothetical protein
MKSAKRECTRAAGRDFRGLRDLEDFDVEIPQLHEAIVGAPRMPVARADREAGALIEFRGRIEIPDGMRDMVETSRRRADIRPPLTSPTRTQSAPATD